MAPDALLAVHLAEGVVQHHIGRAGRVGARIVADDGVEAEQRFHQIGLEALVQHLAGRAREQIEQVALLLQRQVAQHIGGAERVEGFADCARTERLDQVRRGAQHQLPQHVGDRLELAREVLDRFRIMRAELRNRLRRAAFAGQEIAAVGCGQKILRAALHDPQAVIGEPKLADHLRVEQADGVGRDRIAEAVVKFLGDRGAADDLAPLDDLHGEALAREIGRAGEAIMSRPDDDDVRLCHVSFNIFIHSVIPVRAFSAPRNDVSLAKMQTTAQRHVKKSTSFPALPAASPCAPLRRPAPAGHSI